jgi:Phage integrase family
LFPGEGGGYLDGSALRRRYKAAAKRAGLRPIRLHDLRHTFGSLAGRMNVSNRELQEWMGHADAKTTARYTHYAPAAARRPGSRRRSRWPICKRNCKQARSASLPRRSALCNPPPTKRLLRHRFRGTRRKPCDRLSGLPCRRSWVRNPSSALGRSPATAGFLSGMRDGGSEGGTR